MKKSEIYSLAQIAVLTTSCISPEKKVDILKQLFLDEELWVSIEESQKVKETEAETAAVEE